MIHHGRTLKENTQSFIKGMKDFYNFFEYSKEIQWENDMCSSLKAEFCANFSSQRQIQTILR